MDMKAYALDKVVTWILGGDLFNFIKELVAGINNDDISGEDKKSYVFTETKAFFKEVSTVLLNIGIEVAVLLLRTKYPNAGKTTETITED